MKGGWDIWQAFYQLFWIVLAPLKFGEAREFSVLHARTSLSALALALVNFQNTTKHLGLPPMVRRHVCILFVSHGVVPRRQLSSQSPPACDKKVRLLERWVWGSGSVRFGRDVVMIPRCMKQEVAVVLVVAAAARSHEEEDEAQAEAAPPATCPQAGMV